MSPAEAFQMLVDYVERPIERDAVSYMCAALGVDVRRERIDEFGSWIAFHVAEAFRPKVLP